MFLDAFCLVLVHFYDPSHLADCGIFGHKIDDLLNQLSLVSRCSVFVECKYQLACHEIFFGSFFLLSL